MCRGSPRFAVLAAGLVHDLAPGGRGPRTTLVDAPGSFAGQTTPLGVAHHRPLALSRGAAPTGVRALDPPRDAPRDAPPRGATGARPLVSASWCPPSRSTGARSRPGGPERDDEPERDELRAGPRPRPWVRRPARRRPAATTRVGTNRPDERRRASPTRRRSAGSRSRRGAAKDGTTDSGTAAAYPGQPGRKRRTRPRRASFKEKSGGDLLSQGVSSQVPSALVGLTSVFGMGTGVTPPLWPPKSVVKNEQPPVAWGARALEELHSEHERHCRSKPSAD